MNAAKQELFESVRAVVSGRLRDEAQVREIAYRVSEESTALRRRIDRAVGYARAGLRLESCAEAEAEPSVFELAAAFDAEFMRQWRAMCAKSRLPVQDDIPSESIAEIEEAISLTAPLRARLALMRRLVLSDASAWKRLEVLRELVARDPDNPAWHEDLAALEPVAAKELDDRFEASIASGDLEDAERCVSRLGDGVWRWGGIAKVTAKLRPVLDRALAARTAEQARATVAVLDAEWSAGNEEGVRNALAEWRNREQRMVAFGGDMPADLAGRVAQAEAWLADRDAAADAMRENRDRVAELERTAQDATSALPSLRAALRAAEETSEGVPDDVRAIAERRIGELDRAVRIRRVAIVSLAAAVVTAAVATTVVMLRDADRARRAEETGAAIASNVEAGRFEEANRLLDEAGQDPALGASKPVADARALMAKRQAEIADRRTRFKSLMAEAGDPAAEGARPERIEEAKKYVQDEPEQREVSDWIRRNGRATDDRRNARAKDGLDRAKALITEIAGVKPTADESWDGRFASWESALSDVQRRFGEFEAVMEEIRVGRTALAAQRAKTAEARAELGRVGQIESLGISASSPVQLAESIEAYAKQHPDAPEAGDFRTAASALPAWEAVVAWSRVQPVPTGALAGQNQDERDAAAAAMRSHVETYPGSPYADACAKALPLLEKAPEWRAWLLEQLGTREAMQLFVVERKDGTRWYCARDPSKEVAQSEAGVAWKSVLVCQGRGRKDAFERFDLAQSRAEGPSPQKALAARLNELLGDDEKAVNDVDAAFDVLAALREDETTDGALVAELALDLLRQLANELPAVLRPDLEKAAKRIAREKPGEIDWLNPRDADARVRSRAAKAAVREALQVDLWRNWYAAALASACKALAESYDPAGVLVRRDGAPALLGANGVMPAPGSSLWFVQPGAPGRVAAMIRIGAVSQGGAIEFPPDARSVPSGTMVFVPRKARGTP